MKLPPIEWNRFTIFSFGWHLCHRNKARTICQISHIFCQWSNCASSKVIVIVRIKWVFRLNRAHQFAPKRSDRNWIDFNLCCCPSVFLLLFDYTNMYRFFPPIHRHNRDFKSAWAKLISKWTWTFDFRMESSLTMSVVAFDYIIIRH